MNEKGSLRNLKEVKLLILYILNSSQKPLSRDEITDIIMINSQADYFMIPEAFKELISSDHIAEHTEKAVTLIYITGLGRETIDELYKLIPLYVREKAEVATLNMICVINRNSQISAEIIKCDEGYTVNLSINEDSLCLFSLSLFVVNKLQGEVIVKNFKKNPEYYYKRFVSSITEDT